MLVTLKNGKKYFGEECLFENISFHIDDGQKVGLVGANGAGKTSLFKVLTGEMSLDEGDLFISPSATIGYMKQNIEYDSHLTILEEVMEVYSDLVKMEKELEDISKALEEKWDEELLRKQDSLMQRFLKEGGEEYKSRARGALIGLGFKEEDFTRKFRSLSGGEKTRLLLCRLLLGKHSLLLLDEPTNHLDMGSIDWLEGFLKSYQGAFIVISHDRYFLDKTTNMTIGLSSGRSQCYQGSYSEFVRKRDEDREARIKKYNLQKKEIKRIEGIIAQQKQWNRERNIKTAESKQKMIDRIIMNMEVPEGEEAKIDFSFNVKPGGANEVCVGEHLSKSFGGKTIIKDGSIDIRKGERVFLIGDNGCGKTTLLKMLLGKEKPDSGFVKMGNGIKWGYYEQQHQSLDGTKTVFDEVADTFPTMDRTAVRSALALFLFRNEDCFKTVGSLSGGEKARILLLKMMLSEGNFLILDEPTNHLDIFSKEALEDALRNYEGTILAVSHDRYFINALADKIYVMRNGTLSCFQGDYDYCMEKLETDTFTCVKEEKEKSGGALYKEQKELAAKRRKAENAAKRAEEEIAALEEKLAVLEEKLFSDEASDYEKAISWHSEKEECMRKIEKLYEDWEEANTALSELS